jgi:hypothetical protein
MYSYNKKISKATWLVSTVVLGLSGIHIFFPFTIGAAEEIPYYRWQTVRFSTFLTIAYFIIKYAAGSRPVSALAVIDIYFKFMVFIGVIFLWREKNQLLTEWVMAVFWICLSIALHRAVKTNRGARFVKHW